MKLQVYKNPDDKRDCMWELTLSDEEAQKWYKEVMRRFKEKEDDVFDVDEAYECGVISIWHLQSMLDFFKKT